jgi:N-methylhydantoinase A
MLLNAKQQLTQEGFSDQDILLQKSLDMRYAGQGYEITVPLPENELAEGQLNELRTTFDELHRKMFGHTAPQKPVEIVSYRLRSTGQVSPVEQPKFKAEGLALKDAIREHRKMIFNGNRVTCPVYQRELLDVGISFEGPAVIDQLDCTTVLFPGQRATVDHYKNLIIIRKEA